MLRAAALLVLIQLTNSPIVAQDWPVFGFDPASSGASAAPKNITASNIHSLKLRQIRIDGTVDASAIYLHGVTVKGSKHDAFFVTTAYGKTIALDANSGAVLWEYTPAHYSTWAGSAQITNSTPVADSGRKYIYAAVPDGTIQKLAISDGQVLWTTAITQLPQREKLASPLKEFRGHIVAVTAGYIGDRSPYQGHVAVLDAESGKLLHVWNSLCSDRTSLMQPSSCGSNGSAIWGRAGAMIDPANGNIFVATGNGPYNGKTDWGDSLIELDPDATRILGNYTPSNNFKLRWLDLDLGSTSPVLLDPSTLVQGGKDDVINVIGVAAIAGTTPHKNHEQQSVPTPSHSMLFTAPAVWQRDGAAWMFAADNGATAAWTFSGGKLVEKWKNSNPGTSPIVAGGLLYVYDPKGGLHVY
ncbi:MAG: PQQ-binding-like beta-propeller repeat protein, partial [Bryobacteraceae bacterium]